jgi:hypothetical protein
MSTKLAAVRDERESLPRHSITHPSIVAEQHCLGVRVAAQSLHSGIQVVNDPGPLQEALERCMEGNVALQERPQLRMAGMMRSVCAGMQCAWLASGLGLGLGHATSQQASLQKQGIKPPQNRMVATRVLGRVE